MPGLTAVSLHAARPARPARPHELPRGSRAQNGREAQAAAHPTAPARTVCWPLCICRAQRASRAAAGIAVAIACALQSRVPSWTSRRTRIRLASVELPRRPPIDCSLKKKKKWRLSIVVVVDRISVPPPLPTYRGGASKSCCCQVSFWRS